MGDRNFKNTALKAGVFLVSLSVLFFSGQAPAQAGFLDQAGSYFSDGSKTLGNAAGQFGSNALNVWQNIGNGLGEAAGVVAKDTAQASDAFLNGIINFGQTVGGLSNQATKGYDAALGKVKQGTDKAVETVINVLPKKASVKIVAPKSAAKNEAVKTEAKESAPAPAAAVEVKALPKPSPVVQKEEKKKSSSSVPKEIIIYSNKANQESVQSLAATSAKASSASGNNYVTVDAATGITTLKGIKIIGTADFTDADVKGFKQTVVNNYSSGGSTPLVVYNSTSGNYENRTSISGNYGGVSEQFSVGKDLTVGQNATVASILTIGSTSSNGSLVVNGTGSFTGATTLSGAATLSSDLTVNGNTTLGDTAGDTITINGRLSTLNVSDGSTTSSLSKNSFYIAADSSNALGKFYVDSSGNISASGTLTTFGASSLGSHLNPSSDNLYDVGSSSTQWRYGNFQGGLLVADGSTTSTLLNNSLTLAQASGYNLGKFYVDSSGNVSASGTFQVINTSTLYKDLLVGASTESIADAGFVFTGNDLYVEDQLGVNGNAWFDGSIRASSTLLATDAVTFYGNSTLGDAVGDLITLNGTINSAIRASSTFLVGTAAGTDNLFVNGNNIYVATSTVAGTAYSLVVGNGTTGAIIAGGHVSPSHTGLFDLGRSGLGWNNIYASSTIYSGSGGASLSTLSPNILTFAGSLGVVSSTAGNLRLAADGTNQLQLWTNNNQRMFIDSNGNTFVTGTLQSTGAFTTYGDMTLGDATGDTITINGRLSTLNVSDGSTATSSLANNSLTVRKVIGTFDSGYFNVDSSGNTSASGSLKTYGNVTSTGNLYALSGTASTSILNGSSLTLGQGTNYNSGMFNVDSNGNVSASGTIRSSAGTVASPGYSFLNDPNTGIYNAGDNHLYFITNGGTSANLSAIQLSIYGTLTNTAEGSLGLTLSGRFTDGASAIGVILNNSIALTVPGSKIASFKNNSVEKAFISASGTPTFGIDTGYNAGKFNIDVNGNVSASGTLAFTNTTAGVVSSTAGILRFQAVAPPVANSPEFEFWNGGMGASKFLTIGLYQAPGLASTTFTSILPFNAAGTAGFVFNTTAAGGMMTSSTGVDRVLVAIQNAGYNQVLISASGSVYAKSSFIANHTGYGLGDFAEYINLVAGETAEAGDVVIVDTNGLNQYRKSDSAYAKNVAGVISDTSAFIIGSSGEGRAPLSLVGLVKTKVTDENGPISVGDYLVSASKPGYAMKYDSASGKSAGLVGMALEPLTEGDGKITIMVNKGLVAGGGGTASLTVNENGDGTLSGGENWDFGGKSILNVKSISGANGLWYIDDKGFLMAKEIKADKVQAKKFVVEKESDLKKASVGEATITNNNSSVVVENELITPKVKIFVTFRSNPNSFWWISSQIDGKFEVSLSKVAEGDLTFDYWIVGIEDAPALEPEVAPAAASATVESPVTPPTSLTVEPAPIAPVAPIAPEASPTPEPIIEAPATPPAPEVVVPVVEPAPEAVAPVEQPAEVAPAVSEVSNP